MPELDPRAVVIARLVMLVRVVKDALEEPERELAAAQANEGYYLPDLRDVTTRLEQAIRQIGRMSR